MSVVLYKQDREEEKQIINGHPHEVEQGGQWQVDRRSGLSQVGGRSEGRLGNPKRRWSWKQDVNNKTRHGRRNL